MRSFALMLILSIFLSYGAHAFGVNEFNDKLFQQVVAYNPKLGNSYYCWKIPDQTFLDFLEIYKKRPIRDNQGGLRSYGCFFLWYLLKEINPALVIESGVWRGQTTWLIGKAVPEAKIIAIDPETRYLIYLSRKATYTTEDFSNLEIPNDIDGPVVCFFDDHVNAYDRVLQSYSKGVKHIIFDDNYPPSFYHTPEHHLTLSDCFELEEHKEKADILKKIIKRYNIMPQIIGKTAGGDAPELTVTNLPAIWDRLEDLESPFREKMQIFSDDSLQYRWVTYVELY